MLTKSIFRPTLCAIIFSALTAVLPAAASTIDTFDFTETGWMAPNGAAGVLTGSFSGTVEASGFIEAQDLSAFSSQLAFNNGFTNTYNSIEPLTPGGSGFFSYDLNGGASSLDFIAGNGITQNLCVGAAAPLACGAFATSFGYAIGIAQTSVQPTLTLVSSITAPSATPAPVSSAPEPATEVLAGAGLILIGLLRRPRRLQRYGATGAIDSAGRTGVPSC